MGRIEERLRIIEALKNGRVQHEMRDGQVNNRDLLQSGQVNVQEVIEFLNPNRGLICEKRPHDVLPGITTLIFRSDLSRRGLPVSWYVKCYCLSEQDEEIWFVSIYSNSERKRR